MLYRAGQERMVRERRDRLGELFMTARDAALDVLVTTKQVKSAHAWRLPSYLRGEAAQPQRSPAIRDRTLAKLGAMFPGIVQRR